MDGGIDIDASQDVYEEFIDTDGLVDEAEVLDGPQIKNKEDCPTIVPILEWFISNTWGNINDLSPALGTRQLTSWHKGDQPMKGMLFKNKASIQYCLCHLVSNVNTNFNNMVLKKLVWKATTAN